MLFHRCSPARSSSQDLNGFSTGSRQSVHKTWQHLLHCKIILLFLTCADVGWWWRNYAKGLARLASPSLAETNAQLSHLAVLYSGGARKWKKNKQKCAKSVQFHTFFSARFVNGSLQSVNLSMPNILADIIGCKKKNKKKKITTTTTTKHHCPSTVDLMSGAVGSSTRQKQWTARCSLT